MSDPNSCSSREEISSQPKMVKIAELWKTGTLSSLIDVDVREETAGVVRFNDPLDLFQKFWTDDFFLYIKHQSEMYSKQKLPTSNFVVSIEELKVFIAILLISGYNTLPRRDMYWSLDADLRNEAICCAMSRNRFREILRYIHFADNLSLPLNDKYAKIRPLITHLNECSMALLPSNSKSVDVDESMVPYYSHHSCKQRIQGKPIRYGFKFWSLNASSGYLINTEPYQGKGTALSHSEFGLGGSVVLTFADRLAAAYIDRPFSFYIDNFFTGLPLVKKMTEMRFACTGTIRANRIGNCPLADRKVDKDKRGNIRSFVTASKDLVVMSWKDNATVRVASNAYDVLPTHSARRYSAAEKKHITVAMPHAIGMYNAGMGGLTRWTGTYPNIE
jgi:DNA excision repair protein ERCC-6